ncbi:MAG: cytochrome C peroxidase, partial [Deltaproteobacteria bacterium]
MEMRSVLTRFRVGKARCVRVITGILGALVATATLPAGAANLAGAPPSLKSIAVPEPPDLASYVKDRAAAVRLGKAFFWDMQAGSDGIVACASCHYQAGVDNRSRNTLAPGF